MKSNKPLFLVCGAVTLLCAILLVFASLRGSDKQAESTEETAVASLPAADRAYFESPEYAAAAAWESFCAGFDSDGSVFHTFLTGGVELDKKYELYPVYSQEMADELERICSQYGLTLHGEISYFYSAEELYTAAATGPFIRQGGDFVGYIYDDGSFHFDGNAYLSGNINAEYRFDRHKRGILAEEKLLLGRGENWQSWDMVAKDGRILHLALGNDRCVIHAALPDSFVSITVLAGAAGTENHRGITAATLEELAACFDWNAIT